MVVRFSRKAEYDRTRESRSNLPINSTSINSTYITSTEDLKSEVGLQGEQKQCRQGAWLAYSNALDECQNLIIGTWRLCFRTTL